VTLEQRPATTVQWLRRKTKDGLARLVMPLTRACIRRLPFVRAKQAVWDLFVVRHLWWREFDFAARTRLGVKIVGNTSDPIQRFIYYFGVWEPNLTALISERLKPGDVFVDVGANIGYFSLLAAKLVGSPGKVVAIEASPEAFHRLERNLRCNRARNVRAVNVAVSDCEEDLQFYAAPENESGRTTAEPSLANHEHFVPSFRMRALPLALILSKEEVKGARLMKIDVEGYEWPVLLGLVPMLEACRSDLEVVVEVTPSALARRNVKCADLLGLFGARGFHPYRLNNEYTPKSYLLWERPARPVRLKQWQFTEQEDLVFSRLDREML